MSVIRVAVVDGHESVRAGLHSWFAAADPPIETVGGFGSPAEYLRWLPAGPPVDVVVTEIQQTYRHTPDMDQLRQMCDQHARVIVHSRITSHEVILAAMCAGAVSYVAKSDGRQHLLAALHHLADGGKTYVGPHLAEALHRSALLGRLGLSQREREVLLAWLHHDSKDDVAHSLHISPATVRTHLQRIRTKYAQRGLSAPTKSAMLARAIEDGLVGLADFGADDSGASHHGGDRTADTSSQLRAV